ncbi:N-acetylgalactosamine-N,N'-diacetylbacillosaminyl -diphospho-undecaprenol 4-alpha-N-acetylgalactosaminyltransferase [Algoriphagus jejuensis]|uniref:N-acetylgalactosamine-N, N'-diacetylbacillosaminyl -diphospho-undecaprenol 4-alpha-N-acetylgalactosaminyltransferase n=1 Tax=Algoriphagus jejuensis TaxID=419934 RepID=A0ABN1N658_9BACT
MRILCVIDSLGSGGAQRQLVQLAIGFRQRGYDVSFIVYHELNFFKPDLDLNGISVKQVIEHNYLLRIFKIAREISRCRPDVVISFLEGANFICEVAGLFPRKWKLIVGERSANPEILTSFKLICFRYFHLFADKIVYNSFSNQRLVQKINPLLSNRKCHVIYNLIDSEIWGENKFRESLNGNLTLVIAASHQYLKNAKGLIEAVNRLSGKNKKILKIEWYGDISPDNSFMEAKNLVNEYSLGDIISFFPSVRNIFEKYYLADAVGLFSFYEGFPNTISEAMSIGKIVVASSVSDIPLVLDHCPDLICDPANVESIQKSLEHLIELTLNERMEIGCENRRKARTLFKKDKIIYDYLQLMR